MTTEADTCRQYVLPKLYDAGWADDQIGQERYFTDGRVVPVGWGHVRKPGKRADYLLSYRPGFPIAVVESKASYKHPSAGMQQAMEYAEVLRLKFAYATNGLGIEEFDFITGKQTALDSFPSPEELWRRWRGDQGVAQDTDADPFDLLIHVAFHAPLRSRGEQAETVRCEHRESLETYGPQTREVLDYLLEKYTDHGVARLTDLHILEMPDVPVKGTVLEIAEMFGGVDRLKEAATKLQDSLYAA